MLESCRSAPGVRRRASAVRGFCHASRDVEVAPTTALRRERSLVGRGGRDRLPHELQPALRLLHQLGGEPGRPGLAEDARRPRRHDARPPAARLPQRHVVTPTITRPRPPRPRPRGRPRPPPSVVYNTCGWERLEVLKVLDGVWTSTADFKYWDGKKGRSTRPGPRPTGVTREGILEMHRQVGVARPPPKGSCTAGS